MTPKLAHVLVISLTLAGGCTEADPSSCTDDCTDVSKLVDPTPQQAIQLGQRAPSVHLASARIDTTTGAVLDGETAVAIPSFVTTPRAGGVPIRVFVVEAATIHDASVFASATTSGPAFALLAQGDVEVAGTVTIASSAGQMHGSICDAGDGSIDDRFDDHGDHASYATSGGGGGGFGTAGGDGGGVTGVIAGGAGGASNGTDANLPLRGGCAGGNTGGVGGGGALLIASHGTIDIEGALVARGADGKVSSVDADGGVVLSGGGSGGAIVLEAPVVTVRDATRLVVNGGTGAGTGPRCADSECAAGGLGAHQTAAAESGTDAADHDGDVSGGAGGGGLGRIRIEHPVFD